MTELTEDFLKMLQIALIVVGILSIFFVFVEYNIILKYHYAQKEALMLGDALLASDCLTEIDGNGNVIKSLFTETKLDQMKGDNIKSCIKYPYGTIVVTSSDDSWEMSFGQRMRDTEEGEEVVIGESTLYLAVKKTDGTVVPAKIEVKI